MLSKLFKVHTQNLDFKYKLSGYLELFLGLPYSVLKLGYVIEQPISEVHLFDILRNKSDFNYTLETFDCLTLVETILALIYIKANSLYEFKLQFETNLQNLRYIGRPTFINRNHFASLDWLPNNSKHLSSVTEQLNCEVKVAKTVIDKTAWLHKHPELAIKCSLTELRHIIDIKPIDAKISYIDLDEVLKNIDKLPEFSVIWVVRKDWDLLDKIGTNLNVSHLGIGLNKNNELYFYHASILGSKTVVKEKLIDYLHKMKKIKTIAGLHISSFNYG